MGSYRCLVAGALFGFCSQNQPMADIPRRTFTRTARLASLPIGAMGRSASSLGKRLSGVSAEQIAAENQTKTAEQLFRVLGELKGGAMKIGQALSVMEAAFPEDVAAPYRASLTKLQDSAPPMEFETVAKVMTSEFGENWQDRFQEFSETPAAAASLGQVHQAVSKDGRKVAVKIQYPGADKALLNDFEQAARFARIAQPIAPGLDFKALMDEMRKVLAEELDYFREAQAQRVFALSYDGDPNVKVPHILAATAHVLISEWIDGTALSKVIESGTKEERDRAGDLYQTFLLSGPTRVGMLHADPHPGNFRITPDNKLGVLDFGAVARLPEGFPSAMGRLLAIAMSGDADRVIEVMRDQNFILPNVDISPTAVLNYLSPFTEPAQTEKFEFTRDWMREQFGRVNDPRNPDFSTGLKLNLPPQYVLVHRVWLGCIGVLSQLNAEVGVRAEIERSMPGFLDYFANSN
jgi:predicted unusual protein kinase regulating ubiquinone biosynthesis (AarF/ABC1/UbiB family)